MDSFSRIIKFANYKLEFDDVGYAILYEILNIGCAGCFCYKHQSQGGKHDVRLKCIFYHLLDKKFVYELSFNPSTLKFEHTLIKPHGREAINTSLP